MNNKKEEEEEEQASTILTLIKKRKKDEPTIIKKRSKSVLQAWRELERAIQETDRKQRDKLYYFDSKNTKWKLQGGFDLTGLLPYHKKHYYSKSSLTSNTTNSTGKPAGKKGSSSTCSIGKQVEREVEFLYRTHIQWDGTESIDMLQQLPVKTSSAHKLNSYTKKIWNELQKRNILLIGFQVPVVNIHQKFITFVDAVGIQLGTGKHVLVELKTGYDVNYTKGKGTMRTPSFFMFTSFASICVSDTNRNRHLLQVLDTTHTASKWLGIQFEVVLLIVAHKKSCEVIEVSPRGFCRNHWCTRFQMAQQELDRIYSGNLLFPSPVIYKHTMKDFFFKKK